MLRNLHIFIALFVALSCQTLSAQTTAQMIKSAKSTFESGNYKASLPLYEALVKKAPTNPEVQLNLGISYLYNYRPNQGIEHIEQAGTLLKDKKDANYYFWLGRGYHLDMNFAKAIKNYRKALSMAKTRDKEIRESSTHYIEQLHRNRIQFLEPRPVTLEDLPEGVNTIYTEHTPIISKDGNLLIFTSRRPITAGEPQAEDGEFYEKVFVSEKNEQGIWGSPRPLNMDFNQVPESHFAGVQLIENDNKILLYESDYSKGVSFYTSTRTGDKWGKPEPMDFKFGSHKFHSDVYFNSTLDRIYFVDYANKSQEEDLSIYYVEKEKDGKWGKAVDLGDVINTKQDERSPILVNDSTLIFCSKGHNTFGSYDIYKSHYDFSKNDWGPPVNLGVPINSAYEDVYFFPSEAENTIYIASSRPYSIGETDIYRIKPIIRVRVTGLIAARDGTPMKDIEIAFQDTEDSQNTVIAYSDEKGEYDTKLTTDKTYDVTLKQNGDTVYTEGGVRVEAVDVLSKDFDGKKMQELMLGQKNGGGAGSVTLDEVVEKNFNLSGEDQQGQAVVDTDNDKMKTKAGNNVVTNNLALSNMSGTNSGVNATSSVLTVKNADLNDLQVKDITFGPLRYVVHFDYNKALIIDEGYIEIQKIKDYISQEPNAVILIEGHTDAIGTVEKNNILSNNRTAAAKRYLSQNSIPTEHMKLVGYGEVKPTDTNKTEAGRAKNRRVEIRVGKASSDKLTKK